MPPSPPPRRRIIDVPPEWISSKLDPETGRIVRLKKWRAKTLGATVGERVVERQCQRAEQEQGQDGDG